MDTTVALVRTRPETVLADYARLLRLAGLGEPAGGGARPPIALLLEPAAPRERPAATCPPWQLDGVIRALLGAGWPADELAAIAPAARGGGADARRAWRGVLADCGVDSTLQPPPAADRGRVHLVLSGLRTHRSLGVSAALLAAAAHLLPPAQRRDLDWRPDVLAAAWRRQTAPPIVGAVVDATVCGDGPAPALQVPVAAHLLLAGRDAVAVDVVAAQLLGCAPRTLPLTRAMAAAGLGCDDLARIAIAGDIADSLPSLGLIEAARYGGPPGADGLRWLRRFRSLRPVSPLRVVAVRKGRRRYEDLAWGRLQRDYDDRSRRAGGAS
ncbi:MAG TPA: hypothetical protein PLL30_13275 [Candidatus Krumholzibacteria bacterium]|nr:hypothetical protein [Candidatus Krumholzibacteria bacterium]HPD72735.1 hypothetical protein [Candidatus Krumholzibacteria bacterium]HRY40333.1 hypothetical protein [Candidatus Krumholzibacteria bacterium]